MMTSPIPGRLVPGAGVPDRALPTPTPTPTPTARRPRWYPGLSRARPLRRMGSLLLGSLYLVSRG